MLYTLEFKGKIKKELKTYLEDNDDSNVKPVMLWDTAKAVLQGENYIRICTHKKNENSKLLNLQKQLTELEQQHSKYKEPQLLLQMTPLKQN